MDFYSEPAYDVTWWYYPTQTAPVEWTGTYTP
jgi:hypothetical protein